MISNADIETWMGVVADVKGLRSLGYSTWQSFNHQSLQEFLFSVCVVKEAVGYACSDDSMRQVGENIAGLCRNVLQQCQLVFSSVKHPQEGIPTKVTLGFPNPRLLLRLLTSLRYQVTPT